jgi:hypothetical protein
LSILPLQGLLLFVPSTYEPVPDRFYFVFDAANALIELAAPQARIAGSKGRRVSAPPMGERACSGQLA